MDSRTKFRLERAQIEALVRQSLGTGMKVESVRELTEGMFNASYALELEGHPPAVLKVAPPPSVPLLTYEQAIMRTEVELYDRVRRETSCPVPRVLARDFSRSIIPSDCFFMEMLQGSSLYKAKRQFSKDELSRLRLELGELVGKLRAIRGDFFGYLQPETRTRAATWRESFLLMVTRLVEDAERFSVRLPRPSRDLLALFEARAGALDAVTQPGLVHFDLWEGNVFVRRVEGVPRIEAIIDGERAFWGDPDAELVSVALFGDIEKEADVLRGYEAATGMTLPLTDNFRERQELYRTYLYLIMIIEGTPRGYSGLQYTAIRGYAQLKLRGELRKLEARARGRSA
jgi:fructosamine-3-kinase